MQNMELNEYLRQIKMLFPDFSKLERRFFQDLRNSIKDYLEIHPDSSMDDIIDEFGTPQDIIYNYIESMDICQLTRRIGFHKIARKTAIIILCFVIVALTIYTSFVYLAYLDSKNAIVTIEQTIIK